MASNSRSGQDQNHVRVVDSLLGKVEKRVLLWCAARTPSWVTPDLLTTLGLLAAFIIFFGYALSIFDHGFLWLANLGFVLHWYGDSMDGTLARYRKIERPRYGFFVDHIMDAVSTMLIFLGIGLSPYVRFDLALLTLAIYLMVSIFVYLATYVNGVFRISYGGLGPTETRLIAVIANTIVFFSNNPALQLGIFRVTFYDIVAAVLCVIGVFIFAIGSIQLASTLSKEDRIALRERRLKERAARKLERTRNRRPTREDFQRARVLDQGVKQHQTAKRADLNNQ